jgi:hypothetical protein
MSQDSAVPADDNLQAALDRLGEVALDALPTMFDERSGRFCQKAVERGDGYENLGSNLFYTAMTAVGVLRQSLRSPDAVFPLGRALDELHRAASAAGASPQVQSNTLWALALAEDPRGSDLAAELAARRDLAGHDSAAIGHSVKGLAVAAEAYPERSGVAVDACRVWVAELLARYRPAARLFAGIRRPSGLRSALIHRLTSFAAQVYPLHGLGAYYRLSGEAPPPLLREAAERLVSAQGRLGQWWWLYSTRSTAVLEGYPVYSVHQDGMAFMALLPVEALGEGAYREPLARGLDWLTDRNELGADLVRRERPTIFRNIQRAGSDADAMFGISRRNLAQVAARSLHPRADHTEADPAQLEVLHECRPYHLGWLLHACALAAE